MKGQSGVSAGVLIILITVALVLYILFLPPDVRDDLLNNPDDVIDDNDASNGNELKILLNQIPGRIDYVSLRDRTHQIPNFRVDVDSEPSIITSSNSIKVVNSAFNKEAKRLSFDIDPGATEDLILTFNVVKAEGDLIIELNGDEIFNSEAEVGNSKPIVLKTSQSSNELVFFVSSPGWAFFNRNQYSLENIKVIANVKDLSRSESIQTFSITDKEMETLERAELKYISTCNAKEVGTLNIYINGISVFQGIPDCGITSKQDIDISVLMEGSNEISFSSKKGSYIMDGIELRTFSTEEGNPSYFFDVDSKYFDKNGILLDDYDVFLEFKFTDDDNTKSAKVEINGNSFSFRTKDNEYDRYIDDWVEFGTNEIEIIPDKKIDIARLKVTLED